MSMKNHPNSKRSIAPALLLALLMCVPAHAVRVRDVTHLKGRRNNRLIGYGLVVGLNGSGDGSKYETTILTLQSLLQKFSVQVPAVMLKDSKNVAVVLIDATLPENGVREGDKIDVQVSSIGAAKSLRGGRLVLTPLQDINRDSLYAFASGPVVLLDPDAKTTGVIRGGAVMEADVMHTYINEKHQITLVLENDYASFGWSSAIAERINEDASEVGRARRIARAIDPKNVIVDIPEVHRAEPASFIANIEDIELILPATEAKIVINRRTGTIVIGDGVEIGPAVVSHNGMSITTLTPPPAPTREDPLIEQQFAVGIDAPNRPRRAARLQELVSALNALRVPARDIIEIIELLHRSGKLTGKLEYVAE